APESRRRSVSLHSRPQDAPADAPWIRHASGVLAAGEGDLVEIPSLQAWPPPGAAPLDVEGLYERFAEVGFDYGPSFQGLQAAWRLGEEIFAEVRLGPEGEGEAHRFGLHPALFDAALHALALGPLSEGGARMPFAWSGLRLHATGASSLRVHLAPAGPEAVSV